MTNILKNLITGKLIGKKDIEEALTEICENVHAECDDQCPLFKLHGDVPKCSDDEHYGGCMGFKDGKAMLKFIKKELKGNLFVTRVLWKEW